LGAWRLGPGPGLLPPGLLPPGLWLGALVLVLGSCLLGSLVEAAGEEAEKRKERTGRRSAGVGEEGEGKARRRLSAAANLQVRRRPLSLFSSFPI